MTRTIIDFVIYFMHEFCANS